MEQVSQNWLERARNGDAEAFALAFEEHRPTVFAVATRLVGPDEADDVTMETFLRAWRAIGRFNGRSSLKSWLYRIAYNCAIDAIRKRKRNREVYPDTGEQGESTLERMVDQDAEQPSEQLELDELGSQLNSALQRLSEAHRTALLLRYSDGLSYGEIAAATGVALGTVMSRLFNAKRRLRQVLQETDSFDTTNLGESDEK